MQIQNCVIIILMDYFVQTLSFLLNLSLIKYRRGIVARLTPPYIKVNSTSIGSADGDCQSYADEVNIQKRFYD